MKRLFAVIFMFTCLACVANERTDNGFSKKFIEKFQNCDVYIENASFNMAGTVFHDSKQILGKNGKMCQYKQVSGTANGILTVTCSFNDIQTRALYSALLIKSNPNSDFNKTEEIWQKHMQNKNTCRYNRSEYYSKGFQVDSKYLPAFN